MLQNCTSYDELLHRLNTWNHKGWKRPLRPFSPTISPSPLCPLTMSLCATSTQFMNTSRDGDSTTSLGSLFQYLTALSENNFFPNIQLEMFPLPLLAFDNFIHLYCGICIDFYIHTHMWAYIHVKNPWSPSTKARKCTHSLLEAQLVAQGKT